VFIARLHPYPPRPPQEREHPAGAWLGQRDAVFFDNQHLHLLVNLNYIALKCKCLARVCKLSGENSGIQDHRVERNKVMALAQARQIDAILVTELTRWGRSTMALVHTLHTLQARGVSLIAQTGWQFDLSTPQGKLIASLMSALAEFERDLLRERIRSGLAAAKARGTRLGRRPGQRIKADRLAPKVLECVKAG